MNYTSLIVATHVADPSKLHLNHITHLLCLDLRLQEFKVSNNDLSQMSFSLNVVSDDRESTISILDKMVTQIAKSHARFIDLTEKEKTVIIANTTLLTFSLPPHTNC